MTPAKPRPNALLRIRTAAVLRAHECAAYAADMRGAGRNAKKKNILIFGQGRSGTTLFETLMISTGHFRGMHEVLNTYTREIWWPTAYVRGLGRRTPGENVIVHVKPEHLGRARKRPVDARAFLQAIAADGWHIVHIQRKNVVAQMMSKYVAKARGGFHKHDAAEEALRLEIPESEFIEQYQRRRGWLADECKLLDGLPHTKLTYEDNLEHAEVQQQSVNQLLDSIGLEQRPVSTRLRKINTYRPEDLVTNLEALRTAFAERGWTWTL